MRQALLAGHPLRPWDARGIPVRELHAVYTARLRRPRLPLARRDKLNRLLAVLERSAGERWVVHRVTTDERLFVLFTAEGPRLRACLDLSLPGREFELL
jgi:hypothetical protein